MHSPAEHLGLTARQLDARLASVLARLAPARAAALFEGLQREAARRDLTYLRDGHPETVTVWPLPLVILPEQLQYVHSVASTVQGALKRLLDLYVGDPEVRRLLPLGNGEEQWIWSSLGPGLRTSNPVFGRLDAIGEFADPGWQDTIKLLEPNLSGVGGLHMVPMCERILIDALGPLLATADPTLRLERGQDVRDLLLQVVLDHARDVGRMVRALSFIEPKYAGSGPEEQERLADYFRAEYALEVTHADPAELELRRGDVWYRETPVDFAYRDYSIADLLELEADGVDIEPMRVLFRQNRVISSVAGEFDHKSAFEILTSPHLVDRYFTADERHVFARHVLWTRVLHERWTELPGGRTGDLVPWVRRSRERCVIKPSRGYGGTDVVLGPDVTDAAWDAALERAIAGPEQWVVQALATVPTRTMVLAGGSAGALRREHVRTVLGFFTSPDGVAVMVRASTSDVVNVAQHGGLGAVLTARAAE